jgi:hypothetical protein
MEQSTQQSGPRLLLWPVGQCRARDGYAPVPGAGACSKPSATRSASSQPPDHSQKNPAPFTLRRVLPRAPAEAIHVPAGTSLCCRGALSGICRRHDGQDYSDGRRQQGHTQPRPPAGAPPCPHARQEAPPNAYRPDPVRRPPGPASALWHIGRLVVTRRDLKNQFGCMVTGGSLPARSEWLRTAIVGGVRKGTW